MNEAMLAVLAGLTLGALHAFDTDHVVAVSVFVSRNPKPRRAALFGVRWALGHTIALLVFGLAVMTLKLVITPLMETVAEVGVGVMLVALGIWAMRYLVCRKRIHIHRHTHDGVEHMHFHSHEERTDHHHTHSMVLVGAAHGLAGTASVLVIIPMAIAGSVFAASLYILLFGIGTIIAMATCAYLLANVVVAVKRKNAIVWFQGITGVACLLVGCLWILGAVM
jgi:hypothetical protein